MSKFYYYGISIVFIFSVHFYFYKSDFTREIDYVLYDYSQKIYVHDKNASSNVIVVDIDEYSLSKLGQWPWPRILLSKLLDGINRHHPSAVGTDIIFSEINVSIEPVSINALYFCIFKALRICNSNRNP